MSCSPSDNELNPANLGPLPTVPGFGIPISPIQIPFPDLELPEGIPEDLITLVNQLFANIPGGPIKANVDNFSKDILDILSSLLNQLAPYLSLYRMLQPLLNIILCVIDVLCAISNPFKLISAIRKLFKRCLPDLLAIFPFAALLALILALLLLLLALIEYLIERILAFINEIIANLQILAEAVQLSDSEATLAGARKIAYLLCLIEQLFAILIAFQSIFAIIDALARVGGRSVCGSGGSRSGDDAECCDDEVCPPFIRNQEDGFSGLFGQLIYYNERNNDVSSFLVPLVLPPIRSESWQFVDQQSGQTYNFKDIVLPINENIFWPEGLSYTADSSLKKTPYILDMTMDLDPAPFGFDGGFRTFQIRDCVVAIKPYIGIIGYDNSVRTNNTNGTLSIVGGKVYESDGITPVLNGNEQATLNDFIHFDSDFGIPGSDDGYYINNVEYNLRINHAALMEQGLITLGCVPDVSVEAALVNTSIDIRPVIDIIGELPNLGGTFDCLTASIAKFRADVSPQNGEIFKAEMTACLEDLKNQTLDVYKKAILAGASQFTSTIELTPDVQFISQSIKVKIILKDSNGTNISFNVPVDAAGEIASKIKGFTSLGTISAFVFNGTDGFEADLTSTNPGQGTLSVSFNEQLFNSIINRDNDDEITTIIPNVKEYEFVGAMVTAVGDEQEKPRRDEADIARDGGGGGGS